MPEPSLEFIGKRLQDVQIEQRAMRSSIDRISSRLDTIEMKMDTLEAMVEVKLDQMTVLIDLRFDTLMEMMKAK